MGSAQPTTARYEQQLSRSLTLRGNVLITLSSVTPASSVFIIIPAVLVAVGGASFVAFVAAAIVGVFMAYCYAELSSAFPIAGGEYSFAARVLGKGTGFALFLMNALSLVLIIGVIALGTGEYLSAAWSGGNSKWVGVGVIVFSAVVAVLNIRTNAWVTGTFLVLEMAALVVLTLLGFLNVSRPVSTLFQPQTVGTGGVLVSVGWGLVAAQMAIAIFAYNGYGAAVYFAEETRNAARGIAKAIMWSLAITVAAELIPTTAVLLGAPDLTKLLSDPAPMQYFVTARGGATLNTIVSLAIALAIINAVVAITLQAGRTVYGSARDRAYPDPISNLLSWVHPTLKTPLPATLFVGAAAAIVASVVPLNTLITATGATLVVLYVMVALSAIVGRRNGTTAHAHYKMPAWPLAPVAVIATLGLRHLPAVAGQQVAGHHRRRRPGRRLRLLLRLPVPAAGAPLDHARRPARRARPGGRRRRPDGTHPGDPRPRRRRRGPGVNPQTHSPAGEPRARGLGIPLDGEPGGWNAITDVPGVEVGYHTIIEGDGPLTPGAGPVRTGVTVVHPLGKDKAGVSVPAGWHSFNGNGEMTGTAWLDEAGALSLPVGITNTHAVGPVHRGVIDWAVTRHPHLAQRWLLPVVAETWDGYLNDINGPHVQPAAVVDALDHATSGPLAEGSVGGGTGMNCYAFKGGTGTASRRVQLGHHTYTVGVLTQANFGSRRELVIAGRPVGKLLTDDNPMEDTDWLAPAGAGSCIVVVATDAPLLPGQCKALARRVPLGLARTGTTGSHFSGDLFLAFTTANAGQLDSSIDDATLNGASTRTLQFLPWGAIDPLYEAVVQSVEESVLNVLAASRTMHGRDHHRSPGFPVDRIAELVLR